MRDREQQMRRCRVRFCRSPDAAHSVTPALVEQNNGSIQFRCIFQHLPC